ncbi:histidinol-phosphate transaminase [Pectinatus brassicae]|uniref:Histidinol-phosphate aminotransferase n=1 Tax=Pectinatus brassicae TaxID=862415 RepID=A0A840UG34_9FIRM|nr:histidinol-phosphate transaminase [Pectinatus brassicae]MBB5336711.1 histidinol-phosphate aminotransferase [Pectinatus brassicae]
MSRFISERYVNMAPYIPGEQPKDSHFIKLNANETACPPSPKVLEVLASSRMNNLGRYTDPSSMELKKAIAQNYNLKTDQIITGNGSDELLGYIFLTFFERSRICYPDITYGFYKTLADAFAIDQQEIPLKQDFHVDINAYIKSDRHIILANPNAPTGYVLPVSQIEKIVAAKPDRLVVIDEAYIDYGNESCIPLINKYDNLLVIHTMSKSRNLAGAHIGYCLGHKTLIKDLENMRGVLNPFNLSDINMAVGTAAIYDKDYLKSSIDAIIETRDYTTEALRKLDFYVLSSHTNFIFVSHPWLSAAEYNAQLRNLGILARHYNSPERIKNFLRITIGTKEEMAAVIAATKKILLKIAA